MIHQRHCADRTRGFPRVYGNGRSTLYPCGGCPGVDRAVMHAELPPGRQVQHARGWMGWIDDAWHEMPTARVHCTHRVN